MLRSAQVVLISAAMMAASGCSIVYKLPTYQGNYIDQKKVEQVEVGMTPEQVRFLLGTPLVSDITAGDRWDYVAYYRGPRGKESRRVLTVFFENGSVSRIKGKKNPFAPPATEVEDPDRPESTDDADPGNRVAPPPRPGRETPRPDESTEADDLPAA